MSWFGHFKRIESGRIPKMILDWNTEGPSRETKPTKHWMDEVRSMISKEITKKMQKVENCDRAKFHWDEGYLLFCRKSSIKKRKYYFLFCNTWVLSHDCITGSLFQNKWINRRFSFYH